MKIITESSVYVQRKDIGELLRSDMPMPGLISLLGNSSFSAFINNINGEEFVRFVEDDECQYFMNQDWILDFDDVKNLSFDELIKLGQQTSNERNDISNKFNSLPKKEKNELYDETILTCKLLDHKIRSIKDFIFIKKGLIAVPWPIDVKIPENMITIPSVNNYTVDESKTKSNIFQLIKSKFKKNI